MVEGLVFGNGSGIDLGKGPGIGLDNGLDNDLRIVQRLACGMFKEWFGE